MKQEQALKWLKDQDTEEGNFLREVLEDYEKQIASMGGDVRFLDALCAAGVDNWEGYEDAQEMMEE